MGRDFGNYSLAENEVGELYRSARSILVKSPGLVNEKSTTQTSVTNEGGRYLVDHCGQSSYAVSLFFRRQAVGDKGPDFTLRIGAESRWPIPPSSNLQSLEELEIGSGQSDAFHQLREYTS